MAGYSGADISAVCKTAAKMCIRGAIDAERQAWERKQAKKKDCEEKQIEYVSDTEEVDAPKFITKEMIEIALKFSRRSVSKQDLVFRACLCQTSTFLIFLGKIHAL